MSRFWIRLIRLTALTMLLVGGSVSSASLTQARSREEPTIMLTGRECPPGMTEANLDIESCQPITSQFDVLIVSIDSTQRDVTLSDATLSDNTYSWNVQPSDRETDDWGIKQTQLPPGSSAYQVSGKTVHLKQGHSYDFRFTTSEKEPVTKLDLLVFSPGVDGVVIPPSESDQQADAPVESTQDQDPPSEPDASQDSTETPTEAAPMRTEKIETPSVDSAEASLDSVQKVAVTGDPAPLRMAATQNSMIVSTLSKGDQVAVLAGPMTGEGTVWYQVETPSKSVGWIEASNLDLPQAAESADSQTAPPSSESPAPTAAAATQANVASAPPKSNPIDYLYTPGERAVVIDPPLMLRANADPAGAVVDKLENGQGMQIVSGPSSANGYDWYEVTLLPEQSPSGFVAADFIAPVKFVTGDAIYVSDGVVNARSKPTVDGEIEAKIDDGVNGTILSGPENADGYAWYEASFADGSSGWVAADFIDLGTSSSDSGSADAETVAVDDNAIYPAGTRLIVVDPPVNVRPSPDTSGNVLTQLTEGDVVTVVGYAGTDDNGVWYEITSGSSSGYVVGAYFTKTFAQGDQLEVIDGPVYLRAAGRTDAAILTGIEQGAVLTVLDAETAESGGYTWVEVQTTSGINGWVATEFLESTN